MVCNGRGGMRVERFFKNDSAAAAGGGKKHIASVKIKERPSRLRPPDEGGPWPLWPPQRTSSRSKHTNRHVSTASTAPRRPMAAAWPATAGPGAPARLQVGGRLEPSRGDRGASRRPGWVGSKTKNDLAAMDGPVPPDEGARPPRRLDDRSHHADRYFTHVSIARRRPIQSRRPMGSAAGYRVDRWAPGSRQVLPAPDICIPELVRSGFPHVIIFLFAICIFASNQWTALVLRSIDCRWLGNALEGVASAARAPRSMQYGGRVLRRRAAGSGTRLPRSKVSPPTPPARPPVYLPAHPPAHPAHPTTAPHRARAVHDTPHAHKMGWPISHRAEAAWF